MEDDEEEERETTKSGRRTRRKWSTSYQVEEVDEERRVDLEDGLLLGLSSELDKGLFSVALSFAALLVRSRGFLVVLSALDGDDSSCGADSESGPCDQLLFTGKTGEIRDDELPKVFFPATVSDVEGT